MRTRDNNSNILLIKDLAQVTGLSVYTIKFYLQRGLIKESGRTPETNFRIFDEGTVAHLMKIRQLRKEGVSLKEIADRLSASKREVA